jgi:hypothetical protein
MPTAPAPHLARNLTLLGHTDQGGRGDGVQVMVGGGHAYVGHMFSNGVTVIDVRDPRDPRPANYLPAAPGTWNLHLQLAEGLLLVVNAVNLFAAEAFADESAYYGRSVGEVLASHPPPTYRAGMQVYDLADPAHPKEIGFMAVDGFGLHRIWWVGGRWAYASALLHGFSDYVLVTIDMADPARPELAGTWPAGSGRPGRPSAATRCTTPSWTATSPGAPGATAGSPSTTSPTPPPPGCWSTATGRPPSAAAPTPPCPCRTGTCWSWPTRGSPTTAPTR